jgi:hypothetical protein
MPEDNNSRVSYSSFSSFLNSNLETNITAYSNFIEHFPKFTLNYVGYSNLVYNYNNNTTSFSNFLDDLSSTSNFLGLTGYTNLMNNYTGNTDFVNNITAYTIFMSTYTGPSNMQYLIVNERITETGLDITNVQQINGNSNVITETTFTSNDDNVIINENMIETIEYDANIVSTESLNLAKQIKEYALEIKCEDFHGKGSIDDYSELFKAASKIANETKQMQLNIEVDGFSEFGNAADELSKLFANFTRKLENVNIINDTVFLQTVLDAIKKIVNLSNVFGKFKETILITSEIKMPKSLFDTKVVIEGVMDEVNCAMNYINNFVNPDENLTSGQLSQDDKNIISKAVSTIDNWQILCEQGVSIALVNNTDVKYLKDTNNELKQKTAIIKNATQTLKNKLAQMNWN